MNRFELIPRGPYSLQASAGFLEGFAPIAQGTAEDAHHLHMAFVADGTDQVAGVCLHAEGDVVIGEVYGDADPSIVQPQVKRSLSLDVDGTGFPAVGERDPVIGRLQARYPGLRPVCFYSPYEAAVWTVLSQRVRLTQAARVKTRMTEELGPVVNVHGDRLHAFPGPRRLLGLEWFQGLFGRKVDYLHAIALATIEGRLEATHLRSLPQDAAFKELKSIPGIGDFGAQLVLLRGAGDPDYLPAAEPRVPRAVVVAYGLNALPSQQELEMMAERWRPYRTWTVFLLRLFLQQEEEKAGARGSSPPA
jgi:DNA-3-methyladenine glycosylase II